MNNEELLEKALKYANEEFAILKGILISLDELVFEERCAMNCFYCGKYGKNWRCPPNLPNINYKKVFSEFDAGAIIYVKIPITAEKFNDIRTESSIILHKGLLKIEKYLWNHNNSTYLSFIGGACKLCKNGCGINGCNNPYLSRSPIEATGVNIVKTAAKYDLEIAFPPNKYLIRCGVIVW